MFRPCILIPIYNNRDTIEGVLARLEPYALPCLVVNDGSNGATRQTLMELEKNSELVYVLHLEKNGGKGHAIKAGLIWAEDLGFTNAIQVDADGQHHLEDLPAFRDAAAKDPSRLILGTPVFGPDVPKARLYGRELSKFFVRLETLGNAIADPLFGFRVYPVQQSAQLIRESVLGSRMDFDPEIAVRLVWRGLEVVNMDSPVIYPEGGTSHFRMIEDNLRITWLHTRLMFGMVFRLPILLARKFKR